MPRVTHVAKAQQRYETKPVLDEDGNPKRTPVMRNGEQRTTKRGTPIFMTVTVADKTKPLPPYTCDSCGQEIAIGSPMKHITPKSGPYGGRKRTRHESCPTWQVWEYSNSLSAQLARIEHDVDEAIGSAEGPDDIQTALDDAASSVEEIAQEKRDGAANIEDGFGHPTQQSEELEQMADDLDQWAEEIRSADIPEMVECEECSDGEKECETCDGTGKVENPDGPQPDGENSSAEFEVECHDCGGTGVVECDNCDGTGEDIDAWRDQVRDEVTVVSEPPV